jgi:hypothetical protein
MKALIPMAAIEKKILLLRGQKVILDSDLAELYGTTTKAFNQAIKRNRDRFPEDFMFQLTKDEKLEVVTVCDHLAKLKFSPVLPFAFTEHGAIMAASVLNSPRAVDVSVYVVRAFIRLRQIIAMNKDLAHKMAELERKVETHDGAIRSLVTAIRKLMAEPEPKEKKVGFIRERQAKYKALKRQILALSGKGLR